MGFDTFNKRVSSKLSSNGQAENGSFNESDRNKKLYLAKVISNDDPFEMGRITTQILSFNSDGKEIPSEDRLTSQPSFAIPLISTYLHVRPLVGEMVYIIFEDEKDKTSLRYWIGPVITTKTNLAGQSFSSASEIFQKTESNLNPRLNNSEALSVMPTIGEIALQGRQDADLILKTREAYLTAGKFLNNSKEQFKINTLTPLYLQLKQFDNNIDDPKAFNYSQANLQATSINIYSTLGKFRDPKDGKTYETANENLEKIGELAQALHPSVFGDQLIHCLDLIIKLLLTHSHPLQSTLVKNALSKELSQYTIDGKLQDLLSKYVRIN